MASKEVPMVAVNTMEGAELRGAAVQQQVTLADDFAAAGRYEEAYRHLRRAVRALEGAPVPTDELDRLRRENAEAREQSRRDVLTASYNRRYLDERLVAMLADPASRGAAGMAVALVDVDHFKQVNDTHGHLFGDRVLQRIVDQLAAALPPHGFCARYGGEEFALVLPRHELDDAVQVCEAARDRIAGHRWTELHPALRVTVSAGVTHTMGPVTDPGGLIGTADALLYAAKESGRNAVAFRDHRTGLVRLAGPASGRRAVSQATRLPTPGRDRNGSPP
jgi:diguanylate cyclase (GGDEF)-like protein